MSQPVFGVELIYVFGNAEDATAFAEVLGTKMDELAADRPDGCFSIQVRFGAGVMGEGDGPTLH